MRGMITAFSVLLAVHAVADPKPEQFSFAMSVFKGGYGHGCAVNSLTITAAHMIDPRIRGDFEAPKAMHFRYEFLSGLYGSGHSTSMSKVTDLAVVELDQDPPMGYAVLSPIPPEIGEKIRWVEFDFRKQKNVFKPRWRDAKVVNIRLGEILLDKEATAGASGGCAFNESGEVVGLVTSMTRTNDGKRSTGVVGLWGAWWADVDEE